MRKQFGLLLAIGILGMVQVAHAQIPDFRFHLDLFGTYDNRANNSGTLHLYSPLGDASTIQFTIYLEPELRGYVSERLEQFSHDPSRDPLEQYFVEDQGIWKLGKQYLPFGSGTLVRENVLAAKGETKLVLENATLQMAVCDGGPGNQQGIIGRLGGKVGVSAAAGDCFGISPTSFDLIRSPDGSPGAGHGWKQMFGLDGSRRLGQFTTSGEFVWLLSGETAQDHAQAVWDVNEVYQIDRSHSILLGYSQTTDGDLNFIRLSSHIGWTKVASFEPLIRFRDGRFYDLGLTMHVRL